MLLEIKKNVSCIIKIDPEVQKKKKKKKNKSTIIVIILKTNTKTKVLTWSEFWIWESGQLLQEGSLSLSP